MTSNPTVLEIVKESGGARLKFSGRLDAEGVSESWNRALEAAGEQNEISVDASEVEYCDGAGLALLWELQQRKGKISGLKPEIEKLLEPFAEAKHEEREPKQPSYPGLEAVGRIGHGLAQDVVEQISFLGQVAVMFLMKGESIPANTNWRGIPPRCAGGISGPLLSEREFKPSSWSD